MSRSGYSDDCDNLELWRATVDRAMKGKRGQKALQEIVEALDKMPEKKLIHESFTVGGFCTLGVLAQHRNVDVSDLNPKEKDGEVWPVDRKTVSARLDIAPSMVAEIMFMNDEWWGGPETPEERWSRMRQWAQSHLERNS